MIVNRTTDPASPATMTVYLLDGNRGLGAVAEAIEKGSARLTSSSEGFSKATEPSDGERSVTIDMKSRHSSAILKELIEKTGAVSVAPTPQEEEEIRDIEELESRGEIDRERVRKTLEAKRREAALISQARNEAAAIKDAS